MEFLGQMNQATIVISMPKHYEQKRIIEDTFDHVTATPSTNSIFDAGHLIRNCKALVSPDTALVHIASCYDTPVLALYRQPLDFQNFPPFSHNNQILMAPDHDVSRIPVSEVLETFSRLEAML